MKLFGKLVNFEFMRFFTDLYYFVSGGIFDRGCQCNILCFYGEI